MSDVLSSVGTAMVETTFQLRNRGSVLVLGEVNGLIPRDGEVWNGLKMVSYVGPEIMDGRDGPSKLAITIADPDVGSLTAGSALELVHRSSL